jgi:hypothetical protein
VNKDILLWSNIEIMNALDKWGVITIRNLHSILASDISLTGLRRKVHKLANEDYIHISRLDLKNEMIVLPTKKTLDRLKSNRSFIDENLVYHNLFISILGMEFINREKVFYFNLPHEYQTSRVPAAFSSKIASAQAIGPDAYLGVTHNEKIIRIGIEVELTQKSSDRVYDKYTQYKESEYFDYVIYFFKNRSIFTAYKKRLNELTSDQNDDNERKKLNSKIIFLFSSQKHQYGSILENSVMECLGKEISIEKFFGKSLIKDEQEITNQAIGE